MKSAITSDRDGLLALVRDKTEAGRRRLTGVIDDLFFAHRDVLSDRERALMAEILRQLVHAIELPVRRGLAERLAELPDAPHDMMLSLADDELEIVYARLIKGDVLHDRDLVELVHHRALEHQLAATIRMSRVETSSETPAVWDDGAGPDVIKALIDDRRGRIAQYTMDHLVEESQRVDTYENPLLAPWELDRTLHQRLNWWIGAALRSHVLANCSLESDLLDDCLDLVINELNGAPAAMTERKADALAGMLSAEQAITAHFLLKCLRDAEIALFASLFGNLTGIRRRLLFRLLFEPGGQGLCIACRGTGVDRSTFASIYLLTRKVHGGEPVSHLAEVTEVLSLYDRIEPGVAAAMVRKWQRSPVFLEAVWRVGRPRQAPVLA